MTDFRDKYYLYDVRVNGSTDKGLWVRIPDVDPDKDQFIPSSQIDDDSPVYKEGDEGDLIISGWFADQRGWS